MKVRFLHSDKDRELNLGIALKEGAHKHGQHVELRPTNDPGDFRDADVFCMVGVKSHWLFKEATRAGGQVVYFDKGYSRHRVPGTRSWEYWRVSVNAHHPIKFITKSHYKPKRMRSLGFAAYKPWRRDSPDNHVLLAGSSAKYHTFYGLPAPTTYYKSVVVKIRQHTDRRIIYRPKPTWKEARPLTKTLFSGRDRKIGMELTGAHVLITHGSNACFEALMWGVPTIILGQAVTLPISSTDIEDIETPYLATEDQRDRLLSNLAYCQWSEAEMREGRMWPHIARQLEDTA